MRPTLHLPSLICLNHQCPLKTFSLVSPTFTFTNTSMQKLRRMLALIAKTLWRRSNRLLESHETMVSTTCTQYCQLHKVYHCVCVCACACVCVRVCARVHVCVHHILTCMHICHILAGPTPEEKAIMEQVAMEERVRYISCSLTASVYRYNVGTQLASVLSF